MGESGTTAGALAAGWKAKPRTNETTVQAQRISTTTKPGLDGDDTRRQAERILAGFTKAGIDIDALGSRLQDEGAASFVKSWNDLLACIESKSATIRKAG